MATIDKLTSEINLALSRYKSVENDRSLPEAFHASARGLRLTQEALGPQCTSRCVSTKNLSVLNECTNKASIGAQIFEAVADASNDKVEAYKAAAMKFNKSETNESLVIVIMNHVYALAEDLRIDKTRTGKLAEAIQKLTDMESSLPMEQRGHINNFHNSGWGEQHNAPGGTQNINRDGGLQITGAMNHGPINWGFRAPDNSGK
ncbi:SesA [Moelleriella libera RCEF 2490]|uniref:SesA n=1 Tax=Moelleriella libera RCEF 2490 TaxID=1081109 RepID=A0A162IWT2_9HYPO|nr:SesA [Moelleriella libera RCEF 2490]